MDLALDCDGDALLARVEPAGPTCHRGERSCFDPDGTAAGDAARAGPPPDPPGADEGEGFAWLETLWATIAARAATRPEGSYTARLLAAGVDGPARKVAEEATEVLMAAKDDAVAEAADGRPRPRRARRSPGRSPTSCTTPSCCWPSAACRLPPSWDGLRARHAG